jgi:hypothetical protein
MAEHNVGVLGCLLGLVQKVSLKFLRSILNSENMLVSFAIDVQ